jgi:hypothetical protein
MLTRHVGTAQGRRGANRADLGWALVSLGGGYSRIDGAVYLCLISTT